MANDTSSVLLSVCGIVGIILVLVMLAALVLIRVLRMSIFGVARMLLNTITEPTQEQSTLDVRAQAASRPRSRNLREQAKSLDFDSAVARQGGNPSVRTTPAVTPPPISVQTALPPEQPTSDPPPTFGHRRRRRNTDEDDDGILGNLFDNDDNELF